MISMVFTIICFIIIPKLMPKVMIVSLLLFYAFIGLTTDVLIGVKYPFNFYKIMDTPTLELFDVLIYIVNYPIYGYFFSYVIYKWDLKGVPLIIFIICWCGLTAFIDWMAIQFNVFTYRNGWNLGYSSLVYLFIFTLGAFVAKLFSHYWRKTNAI